LVCFYYCAVVPRCLHSFPTRRSSDLDNARTFIESGPKPLTEDFIRASRYFIYDLLDDFQDANNHPEAIMTLNTISTQLADFILRDRKSTRLNSSHVSISYAVFCLKKK